MNASHTPRNLTRIRPGVFINPSDPAYREKIKRYGYDVNPFQEIREWIAGGQTLKAKQALFRLLAHKESIHVHEMLAPLLNREETEDMLHRYQKHPTLSAIYQTRLQDLSLAQRRRRMPRWISWAGALLLLLLLALAGTRFLLVHQFTYVIKNETRNTVNYVVGLPSTRYAGSIRIDNTTERGIVRTVDSHAMQTGQYYRLIDDDSVYGEAEKLGQADYALWLLNSPRSIIHGATQASANAITPLQLDQLRTAYAYYLTQHRNQPPKTLDAIKNMVPSSIPLSSATYHPSAKPTQAISNGTSAPFHPIAVNVDLTTKRLVVHDGDTVLLSTPVGIGNGETPTPTGTFTVTERIQNHGPSVYGAYIFPLNNSSYAIHGTNQSNRIGQTDSLGCVELPRQADAAMYRLIPIGAAVTISQGQRFEPATSFR